MVKRLYLIGLVLVIIVSFISVAATPNIAIDILKKDEIKRDPTGLDPILVQNSIAANSLESPMTQPLGLLSDDGYFYAYDALDGEVCRWPLDDPGSVEVIADGDNNYFLAGGDWSCDEIWYGCEYNTGSLWIIDPDTGEMANIGGGGTGCNGLAWDPVYNRLYGAGSSGLYEYDHETGEQEFIGSYGINDDIISLVIDMEGVAWAYDVKFSGNAILYNIDLETGEATEFCDMGQNLIYAQDGAYDRDTHTIWMAAYSSGGFFAYWDWDAQEIVMIGNLDSQYTCAMIKSCCLCAYRDVGVKAIVKPSHSGHAVPSMDMELLVKNYGYSSETFDAQMEIIRCGSSGPVLLNENFSSGIPTDWETDFWQKSNSNNASGTLPEARMYKNWQYDGGQYYDNYIQTKPFDATGYEKIFITFRWAFEVYSSYGKYCNFYVKYRNDEVSPWKDVAPWDNPLSESYSGDLWEISCYGFGEEFGENFSIRFEFIGYYYYYNNIYLDDIHVEGCSGYTECSEIEEDISLAAGLETIVEFPGWTPSEWQNESFQDTWETYPVHGFTIFWGDQNPKNNDKWILLELYYPWFYDIEITEIGSPQELRSFPAQTFDVEATITNVGQFPLCCIGIDMEIGTPYITDTLFEESTWPNYYPNVPADGWTDEHKDLGYYYGWRRSNTTNSGGFSPEATLYYNYARADYVFYSYAFDTTEYESLQLNFLTYINHYSGSGLYALEAGYSHDGENWYAAWHEEPSSSGVYEVSVPIAGGSETTYIGFWVKGNPYYFHYWYLDNVEVLAMGLDSEWSDFMCQGDDLEPGEVRVFDFDQWTPEFLAEETTDWDVPYKAFASIDVKVDQDPGNDIKVNDFKLDYWHDCGINSVESPTIGGGRGDLLWDNGDTDGSNGYSILGNPRRSLLDDFEVDYSWQVDEFRCYMIAGPVSEWEVSFWTDVDDEPGEVIATSTAVSFDYEYTGRSWFGYSEWEVFYEFEPIYLERERYWIEIWSSSSSPDAFLMTRADVWGTECWVNYDDYGFKPGSDQFGVEADCNYQLYGAKSCYCLIHAYIQPGIESIEAIAKNYGTFNELDLTCYAEIWEYITDPENGTQQYTDEITDIDLDTPLGGEVQLAFEDFNFEYEGRYNLFLEMPGQEDRDDFPRNNDMRLGIGVDDTKPVSTHSLDPPTPDGENGWYVNDLEVTLTAYDPRSNDVSSGVDMIKYKVGGGSEQTIVGSSGSFLITQADDADDLLVEYWAIDNVGNVENPHSFSVDMDQTAPTIDLTYQVISGNPIQGWVLEFTATTTDSTSGMDRVEFFLNNVLQETVMGSGPTYKWSFKYHGGLNIDVRADGYDIAGNMATDIVDPVENFEYNQNTQQQSQSDTNSYVNNKLLNKLDVFHKN